MVLHSTVISNPYEASLKNFVKYSSGHLTLFPTFHIRSDFHLKESLQFWMQEMVEKGFILKWWRDIVDQNRKRWFAVKAKKKTIPLNMQHFGEVFTLLMLGWGGAALVLVLELVYKRLDDRFTLTKKIIFLLKLLVPPPMNS